MIGNIKILLQKNNNNTIFSEELDKLQALARFKKLIALFLRKYLREKIAK